MSCTAPETQKNTMSSNASRNFSLSVQSLDSPPAEDTWASSINISVEVPAHWWWLFTWVSKKLSSAVFAALSLNHLKETVLQRSLAHICLCAQSSG